MNLRTRGAIGLALTFSLAMTFLFASPFASVAGAMVSTAGSSQSTLNAFANGACEGGATITVDHNFAEKPDFNWREPDPAITKVGLQSATQCAYYTPAAPSDNCYAVTWNSLGGVEPVHYSGLAGCPTSVTVLLYKNETTTTSTSTTDTSTTTTTTSTSTSTTTTTTTSTTTTSTTTTPAGGAGCTPGYWKQDQHFGSWVDPYDPSDLISSVFADNPYASSTLLEGLNFPDNRANIKGAKATLLRAAIAAVLNAAHPGIDYPYANDSVQAIVNAVNTQLTSGTRESILALATQLDNANNEGVCALGRDPGD